MPDGSRRTRPKILVLNNENPDWPALDRIGGQDMVATLVAGLTEQGYLSETHNYLDVNANPDLDVSSVLPTSSQAIGYSYGAMLSRIVDYAAERMPAKKQTRLSV